MRSWTIKNLGRKWKDFKGRLWHEFSDTSLSLEEMYEKVPDGVPRDQWKTFVDKKNEEKYKVMCNVILEQHNNMKPCNQISNAFFIVVVGDV